MSQLSYKESRAKHVEKLGGGGRDSKGTPYPWMFFPSWTALRRKRVTDPLCLYDGERRHLEKLARPERALQNLGSDRLGYQRLHFFRELYYNCPVLQFIQLVYTHSWEAKKKKKKSRLEFLKWKAHFLIVFVC